MSGALLLGLTPAANLSRDASTAGYVVGGILAGLGFFNFGMSFRKSADPDYWNQYLRGGRPPTSTHWGLAPAIGRNFAGAQIFGRF